MKISDITKNAQMKPPRVLLYGPAGIGKTTFGASAPRPIFLPIEDGLGRIDVDSFPTLEKLSRGSHRARCANQ